MTDQAKTASLMALALHYPKSSRTDREQALWLSDYLSDLRGHSAEAVEFACRSWRQTPARSFPKVGELMPMCETLAPSKADDFGGLWGPLEEDAYRDLSLKNKIRHHRICTNEAGLKAGPMWKNGQPATPDQLGEKWAHWSKIKANHLAEVSRLSKTLEDYRERTALIDRQNPSQEPV